MCACNSSAVGSGDRRPARLAGFWPSSRHSEIVDSDREESNGLLCPLKVHRRGYTCTHAHTEDGESGVSQRVQWVKVVAARPADLCLVPGTHMVGEIRLP